jgi:hypothetical protein
MTMTKHCLGMARTKSSATEAGGSCNNNIFTRMNAHYLPFMGCKHHISRENKPRTSRVRDPRTLVFLWYFHVFCS